MAYEVEFLDSAKRDLNRNLDWLLEKRGYQQSQHFLNRVSDLTHLLGKQPQLFPKSSAHLHLRKAIINHSTLMFYEVSVRHKTVSIVAIRGAAEDWTNQPMPSD